ncbi:MAG: sugar nucleotide-binding protein [Candidatus Omnitrophica bacterium]|nr:sugar nucleotide-binding protein [Candidatus Omnitrophota bacterium]
MSGTAPFWIIGKNGFIAQRIARSPLMRDASLHCLSSHASNTREYYNLCRPADFDYQRIAAGSVILFLAGISSPDRCAQPDAQDVNVRGTIQSIETFLARGARVIFFSSDVVYGEQPRACDESFAPAPHGDYARMKWDVERHFAQEGAVKIIRLAYVFALDDKFTQYVLKCARQSVAAEVFHPLSRSVVYVEDVVQVIRKAAEDWGRFPPLLNMAGPQLLSRVDLVELYRRIVAPQLRYTIVAPGLDFYRHRPKIIHMTSQYLPQLLGRAPTSIEAALQLETAQRREEL